MKKMYEIECQRTNVTPKEFFEYCKKQAAKKGLDIECWTDFEHWSNPIAKANYHTNEIENEEGTFRETIKIMPYDLQYYFQKAYNFIMEFQFDTDTKGFGYMYAMEYER